MDNAKSVPEDSEEEVLFDAQIPKAAAITSTPATVGRKRKRSAKPIPRRTRLRSSMTKKSATNEKSRDSPADEDMSDDEIADIGKFMKTMSRNIAKMNKNFDSIKQNVRSTVNEAVEPITVRLDNYDKRMDRLENKQVSDIEDIKHGLDERINEAVNKILNKQNAKTKKNAEPTYAAAAAGQPSASADWQPERNHRLPPANTDWYWSARKCLRFFPVEGNSPDELIRGLDEFVLKKMKVPSGVLDDKDINFIRKVKASKRMKVRNEVIVSFTTVEARDLVYSYARNLGEWVGDDGKPLAGMRLEIPERLLGDFKACEQYGHAMKSKHGIGFKRHTKLDDSRLCLYVDIYLPKPKVWARVDIDVVRKDNDGRAPNGHKLTEADLRSTPENKEDASA